MPMTLKASEHRTEAMDATFAQVKESLRTYHATGVLDPGELDGVVEELSVLLLRLERVRAMGGDFAALDVSAQLAWLCHSISIQRQERAC